VKLSFDLFAWWAATISGSIVILVVVSIYLYANSKTIRKEKGRAAVRKPNVGRDFIFVWVLMGLLVFYIISVSIGSSLVFAAGNIIVEMLLIAYLVRNKQEKPQQVPRSKSQ